jgi:hypothetical protein
MKPDGTAKRRLVGSYGGWTKWAAGGTQVLWPSYPTFYATDVASGKRHRMLRAPNMAGYPVGMSRDGRRIAVLADESYDIRNSRHPHPSLIVVQSGGKLIQRLIVPPGWEARGASVYLR